MITNFEEERKVIEQRFRNNFDTVACPLQYENTTALKQGSDTIKDYKGLDKWVRLQILQASAEQVDIGGVQDRYRGIIQVSIFTKEGLGSNLSRKIADQVIPIFNRQVFEGIVCRTSNLANVAPLNGWTQLVVSTEYYRDQPNG